MRARGRHSRAPAMTTTTTTTSTTTMSTTTMRRRVPSPRTAVPARPRRRHRVVVANGRGKVIGGGDASSVSTTTMTTTRVTRAMRTNGSSRASSRFSTSRGVRTTRTRAIVDREDEEQERARLRASAAAAKENEEDGYERWRWRRVMLKVSGEALAGEEGFGISPNVVKAIASEVAEAALSGVEVAVVVGGGNFFRGAEKEGNGLDRASADYMGMLATVMNSLNLQAAIESNGVPTRVMSALEIKEVAEPYIRRRAIRHLEKGRVVIFGAGTGNPFFTTDTGAALRAAEINAQAVLKATKVDGVFDSDPKKNADAKLYKTLTYETVRRLGLGVMDQTAITLCEENDIPVVVFNIARDGNIVNALRGRSVGTCVGSADKCSDACE